MFNINMLTLILPVSGGGFVSQLAIIEHLCENKFIPDVTLASSGGNVAAYISAAADWHWPGIERIARTLNKSLFITPHSSIPSVAFVIGYFEGYSYAQGSGVTKFLKDIFTESSIQKYEIWTGTYNSTRQLTRLFCNRNVTSSILKDTHIDRELTQSMPPIYADGNIDLISKYSTASASIPTFVPPQTIDNEEYADGGVSCSSPVTVMQDSILHYIEKHNAALHMIYVNSIDLSSSDIENGHNLIGNIKQTAKDIIRSQIVIDRLSAYELLRCHPGIVHKETFPCNFQNLQRIHEIHKITKFSLLEIYPLETYDVDLTTFTGNDVVEAIRKTYDKCYCRLWWLQSGENDVAHNRICQIVTDCQTTDTTKSNKLYSDLSK